MPKITDKYITIGKAAEAFSIQTIYSYNDCLNTLFMAIREEMIEPESDVAPVVHGRWEYDQNATDWGIGGYVCSVCKNKNNNLPCSRVKSVSFFSGAKYCPNCGARMDGETE